MKIDEIQMARDETIVTLKEYTDVQIEALRENMDIRFKMAQEAIDKTERSVADKFLTVNEFRGQSKDREAMFATRAELALYQKSVDDSIKELMKYKNTMEGKASMGAVYVAYIISLIGIAIGIINLAK